MKHTTTKHIGNTLLYVLLTLALILFGLLFFSLHASGQEAKRNQLYEETCRTLEDAYRRQVRSYLNDCGYENIGVTVTHIDDEDHARVYILTLHHRYLDKLDADAYLTLCEELTAMSEILPQGTLRIVKESLN